MYAGHQNASHYSRSERGLSALYFILGNMAGLIQDMNKPKATSPIQATDIAITNSIKCSISHSSSLCMINLPN